MKEGSMHVGFHGAFEFRVRTANQQRLSRHLAFITSPSKNCCSRNADKDSRPYRSCSITVSLSFINMAFIKQEPLSDDLWDQLIKNFEDQPDAYFLDHQNTTFDQDGSSMNNTANQDFGPATSQVADCAKSEPVDQQVDWTFMDPADQPSEMPVDNGPRPNLAADQLSSRLDGLRALYGHGTSSRRKMFTM